MADLEHWIFLQRIEDIQNVESVLHEHFYSKTFMKQSVKENKKLYTQKNVVQNMKYMIPPAQQAVLGDMRPLCRLILSSFEYHCYDSYALALGIAACSDSDDGDGEEDGKEDGKEDGEESQSKEGPDSTIAKPYLAKAALDEQTANIIYYIAGATIRAILGMFVDDIQVTTLLSQRLLVDFETCKREGLPWKKVEERARGTGKLICVTKELLDILMVMETKILSPIIENTPLIIHTKGRIMHVVRNRAVAHGTFEDITGIFQEALSTLKRTNEGKALAVKQCVDKLYDYYLNVALNDVVMHCLPKKWKNKSKQTNNVAFRYLAMLKTEEADSSAQKK